MFQSGDKQSNEICEIKQFPSGILEVSELLQDMFTYTLLL
jgi:hypothetical protein